MVDPTLQAALEGDVLYLYGAIKIEFPDHTLRLLDGAGELTIGGEVYSGEDAILGTLDSIDELPEDIGDEAPQIRLTLNPADAEASATLTAATVQGSTITIMMGAYDPSTNLAVGVPETLFYGELDVPTLDTSGGSREITYTAVSVFERLFEVREGERASDGWHQSIWPGELGLEYMTGTVKNLYWGAKRPLTTVRRNGWGAVIATAAGGALQQPYPWQPT